MGKFPDPRELPEDESVVAVGSDLSVEALVEAYGAGIFPWPVERGLIPWHCPNPRGVLLFSELHLPRSLRRARKKGGYTFCFDQAFSDVIRACAESPRSDACGGTWIFPEMLQAYILLHAAGYAHSVECWEGEELVGGLYGVHVRGVFSGESMFHKRDNTSKLCLLKLIEALGKRGLQWMDIQMVTPVAELVGGRYLSRGEYLDLLEETHGRDLPEKLSF